MRRSKALAAKVEALREFRKGLTQLLEASHEVRFGMGDGMVRWIPEDPAEGTRLRTKVNELSGPAGIAADETGIRLTTQDAPMFGGRVKTFNPIYAWASAVDGDVEVVPANVFDFCDQAIGILERRRKDAEAQERSLAGRTARFVSFPVAVREAAGFSDNRGVAPKAAFGVGVILQGALVTVVGTIVLAVLRTFIDFL